MKSKNYLKFAAMMAVSFVIMYGVMFLNADLFEHVMLSTTRTYMTILMVAPMAISMLLFMWGMYENKKTNYIILASSLIVFISTLTMLRNQTLIADVQWMKAMIPHHSSAIMVSQKAHLQDPEAQKLAQDIIEAQQREIAQMQAMIERLEATK
ncbi:DUF305 domain-containing protein [Algoriphagus sp. AGSA1]|uniref:DUF305 domain-containing protein n=1 Tax=Algoriphagus yeomjeoni TaxID=291403 RepID=A0A327PDW5_9BACT|nr:MULTISPECIES: DUF305 domain-containing protein [Algoriphagus]MCE7053655.1 DUF305 domain-containing protein [Algoriphagus sp. AGSA1]RAI88036.1 protein of unknown function (DUF305) [Algoriphagus yeomjeoni]